MTILECVNLEKQFGRQEAVSGLSFRIGQGEILALLGPNGAGKTTTIKIILGLTAADKGEVRLQPGIKLGYSPETPYFHPFLNGAEVLRFYARLQYLEKKDLDRNIHELLHIVGLEEAAGRKVGNYSKGMLQRLAVAQALIGDPELLILDEPTSGLDALGRMEMIDLIRSLKARGKSILIISHILSDIEKVADRFVFLVKGRIAGEAGREDMLRTDLEQLFVRAVEGVQQ